MVFLYITNESAEEAKKIANHLLKKRMIGCANIFPVNALYWWDGTVADETEYVLIVKTIKEKRETVRKEVERIHPFDVPCIIKLDVDPNEAYFNWIKSELR
ncbi:divalent-cation tolerance protein CutA [Candidatus Woesebacteria bacterium]|nr:divalent-cation tolerance protein CutA [Candidatus Woesebacteria bacterium]